MASTASFYACFHSNCTRLQAPRVHKSLSSNLFRLLFFTTLPTPASTQRFWLLFGPRPCLIHDPVIPFGTSTLAFDYRRSASLILFPRHH
ncbi:hypothetical protein HBI22_163850 [Parastagonospora nodorum]|nr:hypothetical protein HBI22_163850 [Parastagonospora nodorum]